MLRTASPGHRGPALSQQAFENWTNGMREEEKKMENANSISFSTNEKNMKLLFFRCLRWKKMFASRFFPLVSFQTSKLWGRRYSCFLFPFMRNSLVWAFHLGILRMEIKSVYDTKVVISLPSSGCVQTTRNFRHQQFYRNMWFLSLTSSSLTLYYIVC